MKLFYVSSSLFEEDMHAYEMRLRFLRLCRLHKVECVCISGTHLEKQHLNDFRKELEQMNCVLYQSEGCSLVVNDCVLTSLQLFTSWEVFDVVDGCAYLIDIDQKVHELFYLFVLTSPLTYMIATIKDELEHMIFDAKNGNNKNNFN